MMAVLVLAVMASLSAQTAFAGILLSDKTGVTVNDKEGVTVNDKAETKVSDEAWDILIEVIANSLTGVMVSD
jgi:hypothetical protein